MFRSRWLSFGCALGIVFASNGCGDTGEGGDSVSADADTEADPGDDGSNSTSSEGGEDETGNAGAEGDGVYVLGSRIRTPSGRTFYASLLPNLEPQTVDLSKAIELNGFARSFAFDDSMFLMDSESLEIQRYAVDEELQVTFENRVSMAQTGVSTFTTNFVFIAPDRAFYLDIAGLQIIPWNPKEMTVGQPVPIEGVEREGFVAFASGLHATEDRLYVPLGWTSDDLLENSALPVVGVLIIDAVTGETLSVIEDDRCGVAGGGVLRENGDFYVLGDSADGRYNAFGPVNLAPCLTRVLAGTDAFDPDYYVDMRTLTGAPEVGDIVGLPDGTAVTRVVIDGVDPSAVEDPFDLTLMEIWEWVKIDLDAGTAVRLDIPPSALTFPPFAVGDRLAVQREREDGTSTLYIIEGDGTVESVVVEGEILQFGRLR
ncbi:MAG: hypothetical protein AAGA54_28115 [Myxococcota bacterium]